MQLSGIEQHGRSDCREAQVVDAGDVRADRIERRRDHEREQHRGQQGHEELSGRAEAERGAATHQRRERGAERRRRGAPGRAEGGFGDAGGCRQSRSVMSSLSMSRGDAFAGEAEIDVVEVRRARSSSRRSADRGWRRLRRRRAVLAVALRQGQGSAHEQRVVACDALCSARREQRRGASCSLAARSSTTRSPMVARREAGVPMATISPSWMIPMRSHSRSASSR